jgi:hypothetical protein
MCYQFGAFDYLYGDLLAFQMNLLFLHTESVARLEAWKTVHEIPCRPSICQKYRRATKHSSAEKKLKP